MITERDLRLIGAVMGDPFDRRTWSGASYHLFSALQRAGVLEGAVDARPPGWVDTLAKAAAVAPRRHRWRERYEYSPLLRGQAERVGARAMTALDPDPDVVFQVGAYYDFTTRRTPSPRLRCSYHDANLALFSRGWSFVEDPGARHIRAMFRHERRVLDGLDLVMPMSEWLRSSFIEDFGQDPDKVVVVGSGVNNAHLPEPVERDWSVPRLLFIGFEWARKGGPAVLEAWRALRSQHPEATLTVVGPPRPEERLPDGVDWVGPVDRSTPEGDALMQRLHQRSTVFVLLPAYDPMPNAVLEAMSYGLPVVGPRRGSMPEMVSDGESGRLVDATDPDTVAGVLTELADDPDLAERMGTRGRERVRDHFTWDGVADRMLVAIRDRLG